MAYWLLKTEPSAYNFDQLVADGSTRWDGVRNATALQHIRTMRPGDGCVIYHSGDERQGVGLATIITEPYADPESDSDKHAVVDIQVGPRLSPPVTLATMKGNSIFTDSPLVRISRLSVVPLTAEQYGYITGTGAS